MKDKIFGVLQRVGRSFMLPIAILPVAGLLLGFGGSFTNETMLETYGLLNVMGPGTIPYAIFQVMSEAGNIVFANLPIIFAMGVAIGMAKKEKEVAALSAAIAFFIMHASISAMITINGGTENMLEEPKVCHYLDLPIQHANDTILKRMGRRTTKQELVHIVEKLRSEIPDICLRTTLITGFPGETAEQHEELMQFVDEMEFDRLGVFTYSPEEDTPAAGMPEQIEEEVKEDRQAEIMELQQEIAFDKAEDMIGREVLVMIEGKVADENAYVGRTYRDAPNVDGLIFINTNEELLSGDFARVKVTGALDYDLIGELL